MQRRTIQRVLVACRGDVGASVVASVQGAGLEAVAAYAEIDAAAPYLDEAAYAAPISAEPGLDPYIDGARMVAAALDAGADAIHPGLGDLARSSEFARMVMNVGLAWIGPSPQNLDACADRAEVRKKARELGLEVVPQSPPLESLPEGEHWIRHFGAPVFLRPADRGTGRPGRIARTLEDALALLPHFRGLSFVVERAIEPARHLLVPVLGDGQGNALALGEHERSVVDGRRIRVRECPAPGVDEAQRARHADLAKRFATALSWQQVGGVELLLGPDGVVWFHDMHPGLPGGYRLHDAVYRFDLVQAQIQLASGEDLVWDPRDMIPSRHAIELLICATDTGEIETIEFPEGVDVATAYGPGCPVDPQRDPVLARLLVDGPTRHAALVRARAALEHVRVEGVPTDTDRLLRLLGERDMWEGRTHTGLFGSL